MAVSEMVSSNTALRSSRKTLRRLDHRGERGPVSVQIVGADPAQMADAARHSQDRGADIIDINMGCPAKKVCRVAAGSALLRDEHLVAQILRAVVSAVTIPVTLKIRTGWDPASRNGVRIAAIAEDAGVQALAVHGRTRSCGYSGQAEYATIQQIKRTVSIPIIANGDIDTPEKAKQVLDYTAADAVMIGRAARGRPWIFREMEHYLRTGQRQPPPPAVWVRNTVLDHVHEIYGFYGQSHGIRIARKHIAWYTRHYRGAVAFRESVNAAETAQEQINQIRDFFGRSTTKGKLPHEDADNGGENNKFPGQPDSHSTETHRAPARLREGRAEKLL